MNKFSYAPGIPGYGTKGTDGTPGLEGIATYFSSFDGLIDIATITGRIENNQNLFGSAVNIPGYPERTYQTGDYFIDKNSKVFKIDFNVSTLFSNTGGQLNTSGYFALNNTDDAGFVRMSNLYPTYALDNVYSLSIGDYTGGIYQAANMYNIAPLNFATIHYADVNPLNISSTASNYIPFMVFSSGPSYPGTADLDSFAIVKHKAQHLWRIGNVNGDPGTLRDVSLYLDFTEVKATKNFKVDGSSYFYRTYISGNVDFSGDLNFTGSKNHYISMPITLTTGPFDLSIYGQHIAATNSTIAGGAIEIKAGRGSNETGGSGAGRGGRLYLLGGAGGTESGIFGSGGAGGAIIIKAGAGGVYTGSFGNGGKGGDVSINAGDGDVASNVTTGGNVYINPGTGDTVGNVYIGSRGTTFLSNGLTASNAVIKFTNLPEKTTETYTIYVDQTTGALVQGPQNTSSSLEYFGGGIDGSVGISTVTVLTRDMYYDDISILAGGRLNTNGFKVYVRGTLDLTKASARGIHRDGSDGKTGTAAAGGTGGAGAPAVTALAQSVCGGGGAGGAGGRGADDGGAGTPMGSGSAGGTVALANGGQAGSGGKGGNGSGGSGADGGAPGLISYNRPFGRLDFILKDVSGATLITGGAGGGGGGGGVHGISVSSGGGGGAGGAGGGVMLIAARTIKVSSTTPAACITAAGGNGGNGGVKAGTGSGDGGGGGGGAGGWIVLIYESVSGTTGNAFITTAGGTGGTSPNGIDGSAGINGTIHMFNVTTPKLSVVTTGTVTTPI